MKYPAYFRIWNFYIKDRTFKKQYVCMVRIREYWKRNGRIPQHFDIVFYFIHDFIIKWNKGILCIRIINNNKIKLRNVILLDMYIVSVYIYIYMYVCMHLLRRICSTHSTRAFKKNGDSTRPLENELLSRILHVVNIYDVTKALHGRRFSK